MDDTCKPWKAGVREDVLADPRGIYPKRELPIGNAKSLSEMESDFVFFTPAVLYLCVGVSDGPLFDFVRERRSWLPIYYYKFSVPLFAGLDTPEGDRDWNYALWAVRRADWKSFASFLSSLAFYAPLEKSVATVLLTELRINDPLALLRVSVGNLSTVSVFALCVSGIDSGLVLRRRTDSLHDLPRLSRVAPDAGMRSFATAIVRGDDPSAARDVFKEVGRGQ